MRTTLIAILLLAAGPVLGASDEPLVSRMEVLRVLEADDGSERTEPASEALPGDVLEYRLSYENRSDAPLRALVITGPVPANTDYVDDSGATRVASEFVVSIDGGASYEPEPVVRERTLADGSVEEYVVPPREYTHVRWRSGTPIAPEEIQNFRYRVTVE